MPGADIPRLADYLRTAVRSLSHVPSSYLSIPEDIQGSLRQRISETTTAKGGLFMAPETDDVIFALAEKESTWRRLDVQGFVLITLVCLNTEPCVGQSEGLWKLYKAADVRNRTEVTQDNTSQARGQFNGTVGEQLTGPLFRFFINTRAGSPVSRRWAGLLLLELLEHTENRQKFLSDVKDEKPQLGQLIVEGMDKILKVVAGKIIVRLTAEIGDLKRRQELASTFLPTEHASLSKDTAQQFPLEQNSQWEKDFGNYVGEIECLRDELHERNPMGFSSAVVKVGPHYVGKAGGNTVAVDKTMLSIYIPEFDNKPPDFYDIAIQNIDTMKLEGIRGAYPNQTIELVICLRDYEELGYLYLHNMAESNEAGVFTLEIFLEEAPFIVDDLQLCRKTRLNQLDTGYVPTVGKPPEDIYVGSMIEMSQEDMEAQLLIRRDKAQRDAQSIVATSPRNESEPNGPGAEQVAGDASLALASPSAEPTSESLMNMESADNPAMAVEDNPLQQLRNSQRVVEDNMMDSVKERMRRQGERSTTSSPSVSPGILVPDKRTDKIATAKRLTPKPTTKPASNSLPQSDSLDIFDIPGSYGDDDPPPPPPKKASKKVEKKPARVAKTSVKKVASKNRKGKQSVAASAIAGPKQPTSAKELEVMKTSAVNENPNITPDLKAPQMSVAVTTPPDSAKVPIPVPKKAGKPAKTPQSKKKMIPSKSQQEYIPKAKESVIGKRQEPDFPPIAAPVRRSARIKNKEFLKDPDTGSSSLTSQPSPILSKAETISNASRPTSLKSMPAKVRNQGFYPPQVTSRQRKPKEKEKTATKIDFFTDASDEELPPSPVTKPTPMPEGSKDALDTTNPVEISANGNTTNERHMDAAYPQMSLEPALPKKIQGRKVSDSIRRDDAIAQLKNDSNIGSAPLNDATEGAATALHNQSGIPTATVAQNMFAVTHLHGSQELSLNEVEQLMDEVVKRDVENIAEAGSIENKRNSADLEKSTVHLAPQKTSPSISGTTDISDYRQHDSRGHQDPKITLEFSPINAIETFPSHSAALISQDGANPPVKNPPSFVIRSIALEPEEIPKFGANQKAPEGSFSANRNKVRVSTPPPMPISSPRLLDKALQAQDAMSKVTTNPSNLRGPGNTGGGKPEVVNQPAETGERIFTPDNVESAESEVRKTPEILVLEELPPVLQRSARKIIQMIDLAKKPQIISWDENGPKNQGDVRLELRKPGKTPQQRKTLVVPKSAIKPGQEPRKVDEDMFGRISSPSDPKGPFVTRIRDWATDGKGPRKGNWALGKPRHGQERTPVNKGKLPRPQKRPLLESSDDDLYSVPPKKKVVQRPLLSSDDEADREIRGSTKADMQSADALECASFDGDIDGLQIPAELSLHISQNASQPTQRRSTVTSLGSPFPKEHQSKSMGFGSTLSQDKKEVPDLEEGEYDISSSSPKPAMVQKRAITITSGEEESSDDNEYDTVREESERRPSEARLINIKRQLEAPMEDLAPMRELPEAVEFSPKQMHETLSRFPSARSVDEPQQLNPAPKPTLASPFAVDKLPRKARGVAGEKRPAKQEIQATTTNPFDAIFPKKQKLEGKSTNIGGPNQGFVDTSQAKFRQPIQKTRPVEPSEGFGIPSSKRTVDINLARRTSLVMQGMLKVYPQNEPVKAPTRNEESSDKIHRSLTELKLALSGKKNVHSMVKNNQAGSKASLSLKSGTLKLLKDSRVQQLASEKWALAPAKSTDAKGSKPIINVATLGAEQSNVKQNRGMAPHAKSGGRFFAQMGIQGFISPSREDDLEGLDPDHTQVPDDVDGDDENNADSNSSSSYSDSDVENDEYFSDPEDEDDLASWVSSIPEHHQDTAAVFDKITKSLLSFLMTAEERADLSIADYKDKTSAIIQKLKDMHRDEFNSFLREFEKLKEELREKGQNIVSQMEAVKEESEAGKSELKDAAEKVDEGNRDVMGKLKELVGGVM